MAESICASSREYIVHPLIRLALTSPALTNMAHVLTQGRSAYTKLLSDERSTDAIFHQIAVNPAVESVAEDPVAIQGPEAGARSKAPGESRLNSFWYFANRRIHVKTIV